MIDILLVDDDLDLCYLLDKLLRNHGYDVTIATNGTEAIKKFHRLGPDLVLLDLMLPVIDGMEVCWRLRAISDVPIIIISGKNDELEVLQSFQAGANDYITKPFDINEVPVRINAVLNKN